MLAVAWERFKRRKLFICFMFVYSVNNLFTIPFELEGRRPPFSFKLISHHVIFFLKYFPLFALQVRGRRHNSPRQLNAHSHLITMIQHYFASQSGETLPLVLKQPEREKKCYRAMEYKSSKFHSAIRSPSHVRKDRIIIEPQNYRIQEAYRP